VTSENKFFPWQSSSLHNGHPEEVVLGDLKHLLQGEILGGLQLSTETTPSHGGAVLPMRTELLEAIVNTIEKNLIVNVLTLSQEVFVNTIFLKVFIIDLFEVKATIWALSIGNFPRFLSALLQLKVKIKRENWRQTLLEVLVGPDFRILHLEKSSGCVLALGSIDFTHELGPVYFHLFKHLINIFLNGKEISFDSFLFKEFDAVLKSG